MTRTRPATGRTLAFCNTALRPNPTLAADATPKCDETSGSDQLFPGMIWDSMGSYGASTKAGHCALPVRSSTHLCGVRLNKWFTDVRAGNVRRLPSPQTKKTAKAFAVAARNQIGSRSQPWMPPASVRRSVSDRPASVLRGIDGTSCVRTDAADGVGTSRQHKNRCQRGNDDQDRSGSHGISLSIPHRLCFQSGIFLKTGLKSELKKSKRSRPHLIWCRDKGISTKSETILSAGAFFSASGFLDGPSHSRQTKAPGRRNRPATSRQCLAAVPTR